jgi:hypothetical protein
VLYGPKITFGRAMAYKRILEQVVPQPYLETNNGASTRELY